MAVGFLSIVAFNLADAWFVARLGTTFLAAIGFTFPLVMIFYSIGFGLGIGTSSCVSRAIGEGRHDRVKHLTTYSLLLTLLLMGLLAVLGQIFSPAILRLMGTEKETFHLALTYMRIWFLFAPFAVLPMVGNNAIRSTGDTLRPGLIMAIGSLLNILLDPLFIFGWKLFPAMGIAGAAIATGIARLLTLVLSLLLLHHRFRMLTIEWSGFRNLLTVWKSILFVAAPAAATNLLLPLTSGVIIRLIAKFGEEAIAATTAGQRIESFAYIIPMAMGTALVPIIGQNWGSGKMDRVRKAWVRTNWYGIVYSILVLLVALLCASVVAGWFSRDPEVVHLIAVYLRIMLIGAVLLHSTVHTGFAFNAVGKPLQASLLTIIRLPGLVIPLAWLGSKLGGVPGVYVGMTTGHILAGIVALLWFNQTLKLGNTA
jgi:putative MATE family efflux protein